MLLQALRVYLPEHVHDRVPVVLVLHLLQDLLVADLPHYGQTLDLGVHDHGPGLHLLGASPDGRLFNGVLLLVEYLLGLKVVEAEGTLLGLLAHPQGYYLFALLAYHY